ISEVLRGLGRIILVGHCVASRAVLCIVNRYSDRISQGVGVAISPSRRASRRRPCSVTAEGIRPKRGSRKCCGIAATWIKQCTRRKPPTEGIIAPQISNVVSDCIQVPTRIAYVNKFHEVGITSKGSSSYAV